MRASIGFFIGAGLFALGIGLNLYNSGFNVRTGIGLFFFSLLLALGIKSRREGR